MKARRCIWDGVPYVSVGAAARKLGVSRQAMSARIRRGYRSTAEMKAALMGRRGVWWNNIWYESYKAAALANHITVEGMKYRTIRRKYKSDADLLK